MLDAAGRRIRDDDLEFVDKQLVRITNDDPPDSAFGFRVSVSQLRSNIIIPRYYDRSYVERLEAFSAKHDCALVEIGDLEQDGTIGVFKGHGGMRSQWYDPDAEIPYIRTSNISGLEIEYQSNHVMRVPRSLLSEKSSASGKTYVQASDILFVKRGEQRIGDVAIVYEGFNRILTAGEIDIVRVLEPDNEHGISAQLLLYLLAHPQVRAQFEHKTFYETIIWNIADRWRQVLLPVPRSPSVRSSIQSRVESAIQQRRAGLLEMRELWERPPLPVGQDPEPVSV